MQLKKDVVFLAEDELARSYEWYLDIDKLSPEVQIVSLDDLPVLREQGIELLSPTLATGCVLIKNPFRDHEYIDINESEEKIIREKIGAISKIAQQLGAKHIHGHVEYLSEQKLEKTADGGIKYKAVELDSSYKKEQQDLYQQQFDLDRGFKKVDCTETTYAEANKLLKEYHLDKDTEVRDLVEMCKPEIQNELVHQTVRMSVSRELNVNKDFAATLTVMGPVFSIGATTHDSISTKKSVVFECEIDF